jgi:outer membrane protein assembly factor BamB
MPLRFRLLNVIEGFFLILFMQANTFATDWPQWRGPNRDGVWTESGILSSFPSNGLILKWKIPVGFGYSSPIIKDGRLYLTDLAPEQPKIHERTSCFNARSGKRVWMTEHEATPPDWFFNRAQLRGPGSTPIIYKGRVYGLSMFSVLKCLEAGTGKILWQHDLVTEYQLPPSSLDASPLIDNNLLILSIGGKPAAGVVAFDLLTGREVWRALAENASWSSPVIVSGGGVRQLVVWMRESVTSLNPTNGAVYWRMPTVSGGSPGFSAVSTPVLNGDRLLISGLMLQLDRTEPAAKVLWPDTPSGTRRILSDTSTPLFRDDYIYSPRSGGTFVCLDAATGIERWQTNTVTDLRRGASVHFIPNGSSLFLYTDKGDLIRADLSPSGYRELGRTHLIDPTSPLFEYTFAWSAPALANRNLYVRNDRELRCYSMAIQRFSR